MNYKFLAGIVTGMALMFALLFTMAVYKNHEARLSFLEGYIQQIDLAMRAH